jgi:hypothetical protein
MSYGDGQQAGNWKYSLHSTIYSQGVFFKKNPQIMDRHLVAYNYRDFVQMLSFFA